jgi:hypothetical protein
MVRPWRGWRIAFVSAWRGAWWVIGGWRRSLSENRTNIDYVRLDERFLRTVLVIDDNQIVAHTFLIITIYGA